MCGAVMLTVATDSGFCSRSSLGIGLQMVTIDTGAVVGIGTDIICTHYLSSGDGLNDCTIAWGLGARPPEPCGLESRTLNQFDFCNSRLQIYHMCHV